MERHEAGGGSRHPEATAREPGVRLAEVVAALSLATDLGTGHPIERSLRSCLLALHFGSALGLNEAQLREVYYVALLRWVGCTADNTRSVIFDDEIALGVQIDSVELWNRTEMFRGLWRLVGTDEPPLRRALSVAGGLATGIRRSEAAAIAHCEVSQQIADRIRFEQGLHLALGQLSERWDGHGVPGQVRGEELARSVRIVNLATAPQLFARLGGPEAA